MDNDIKKVFQKALYTREDRLSDDIFFNILKKKEQNTKIKFWVYSTISTLSFVGLFPAVKLLISDFTKSGIYEYISVGVFDSSFIVYWKEILLSILESVPLISSMFLLALIFTFTLSLRFISQNIRIGHNLLTA